MAPILGPMVPVRHRVVGVRAELVDTVTLSLSADDQPLAGFAAGQFNMLWAFGSGEVPISVSGDPTAGEPLQHTVRAVGVSTAALCALRVGDVVGVRGPYGRPWDLDGATGRDIIVIAGGIGLAPLRPVILAVMAERQAYGRVTVLVGARSPADLLFVHEVERWRAEGGLDVIVTVDHAERDWHGDVGVVTGLLAQVPIDPANTAAFVCGPEIMMRFASAGLTERGLPAASIQVSLERNMKCAVAHCGRCQLGPTLLCRDGPVFRYDRAAPLMMVRGL